MSTTITLTAPVLRNTPTDPARPPATRLPPSTYQTIDGLLKSHAAESAIYPLVAYPVKGVGDFEVYDARDLDRFTDAAVAAYISRGIQPADPALPEAPVMALLAPSSIEYYVTFLAMNRMGYAVLYLSTRLHAEAYISLMEMSDCTNIITSDAFQGMIETINQTWPCKKYPLLARDEFRPVQNPPRFTRQNAVPQVEGKKVAWIVHSSGSTGFPKTIPLTNMQCLANFYKGLGLKTFCVSPLFHSQCLNECGRALYAKKPMWLGNFAFPVTTQNLVEAMSVAKPELFIVVPYVLKLMSESPEGIKQLQKTLLVKYGGSACPDALGDKLVAAGINIVGNYGATETGFIMDSFRPAGDTEWAYLRLQDTIGKHVLMDEISPGIFECVGLESLPSKGPSNSDDPPNSFRTRDLFTRHPDPAKSNYYKYISRLDDRLTLVNSEKVLPLPIEGRIRQDLLVGEAAVYGAGRSVPGMIVFRNVHSAHLSDPDFLAAIQPSIDAANASAESFSRIPQELIIPMPAETAYPKTDKGTFIRAQLYSVFAAEIEAAYDTFEAPASTSSSAALSELSVPELESFLMDAFANTLSTPLPSTTADIFSCGVDSLQTTRLYSIIRKQISLGTNGPKLSSNVVFEKGTVAALARHLYALRTNEAESTHDDLALMQQLITQYSVFTHHDPATHPPPDPAKQVVLVTGATGSLGAYIIASLLRRPTVSKIYALVRADSPETATARVHAQLTARGIPLASDMSTRLICLPADLTSPTLGLDLHISAGASASPASPDLATNPTHLTTLQTSLTHIIHAAWPVNFNLPLPAFGPSLQGIQNLINFARSVCLSRPAKFYFCSSVSAASGTPKPAWITEGRVKELACAQGTGYGRGKLCGEWVTHAAGAAGGGIEGNGIEGGTGIKMESRVLRVGQLSGDMGGQGRWNATEAIPLLIRCAVQEGIRCLPRLEEKVSWLPVDVCGEAVVGLAMRGDGAAVAVDGGVCGNGDGIVKEKVEEEREGEETVYHVLNPTTLHWTHDVLPALRRCYAALLPGVAYDEVEPAEWLSRLRAASDLGSSSVEGENDGNDADAGRGLAERNPCVKLLSFWEGKYAGVKGVEAEVSLAGETGEEGKEKEKGLRFETHKTLRDAPVLGSAGREVMLDESVDGYMGRLVRSWLKEWKLDVSPQA